MRDSRCAPKLLSKQDITDNIVIVKINQLYKTDLTDEELYDVTRGVWKRTIKSVEKADYCLAVAHSVVVEVYKIDKWYPAGTIPMKKRILTSKDCAGRIEFVGEKAREDIRDKYIGKSVANLFVQGESNPVKVIETQ